MSRTVVTPPAICSMAFHRHSWVCMSKRAGSRDRPSPSMTWRRPCGGARRGDRRDTPAEDVDVERPRIVAASESKTLTDRMSTGPSKRWVRLSASVRSSSRSPLLQLSNSAARSSNGLDGREPGKTTAKNCLDSSLRSQSSDGEMSSPKIAYSVTFASRGPDCTVVSRSERIDN